MNALRSSVLRAVAGALTLCAVLAAQADDPAAERRRIAQERAAALARFSEQERGCQQRFAVTACMEAVQRERRSTLNGLRQQEILLDEEQRRQRAAQRMKAIRDKTSAEEAQRAASAPASAAAARRASAAAAASAASGVPTERARPKAQAHPPKAPVLDAEQKTRNRERFDARQRAAEEHRIAVERRNAERAAARGKPAAPPLPTPGAASAP